MKTARLALAAAAAMICLGACATAANQTSSPTQRVLATTDEGTVRSHEGLSSDSVIDVTPEAAFGALQSAYQDLGIEVQLLDPTTRTIGNKRFSKMYELGGVRLSKYVGCGTTETGPAADNYRITMSLVSRVTQSGRTDSRVETQLAAYAEDLATSKGRISCITLGALEQRIHALAAKHAHNGPSGPN